MNLLNSPPSKNWKAIILLFLIVLCSTVRAQTVGDYRSVASGTWSSLGTWQYFNGSAWVAATNYPGQISAILNTVTLQSPFVVTLNVNPSFQMERLTVNSGATLQDQVGAFNYSVAPTTYFDVFGIVNLINTSDVSSAVVTAELTINSGAVFSAHRVFANVVFNRGTSTVTQDYINTVAINPVTKSGIWFNELPNSILNFRGATFTGGLEASIPGNTVNYSSSTFTQTVRTPISNYFNLTLSGNIPLATPKVLSGNTTVSGTLAIQGTASISILTFELFLRGDWNSSSSSTTAVQATSGSITFNGSVQQKIIVTGHNSGLPHSKNLTFANTNSTIPQITISSSSITTISVGEKLTFTSGVVDLGGNVISLGGIGLNKTIDHTGDFASGWVCNGHLRRFLTTGAAISAGSIDGFFPVGTSKDFRPIYFSTTSAPTANVNITVTAPSVNSVVNIVNIPDTGGPIVRQAQSYWRLVLGRSGAGSSGTYDILAGGTGLGLVGDITDLRLSRVSSVLGTAGVNSGSNTFPMIQRLGVNGASIGVNTDFYVGSVNATRSPLPVELLSFSAETEGSVVNLRWQTSSEFNCDYFTVFRSSNGVDFVPVATKKGHGTTNVATYYYSQDASPLKGINYYLLSQTDFDGKTYYLKLISVESKGTGSIQIYPNPLKAGQILHLDLLDQRQTGEYEMQLVNSVGQVVDKYVVDFDQSGSFVGDIKIGNVPQGLYFIKLGQVKLKLLVD